MPAVDCAIALGSNLGDSLQILQGAIAALSNHPHMTLMSCSSVYTTAPIGPPQPDYLNACALVSTELSPEALLRSLLAIENRFGRIRQERWGPRLLDLDLLLFGDLVLATPELQVPHPRMYERAFVLVPLAEIAGDWRDPVSQKSIAELSAVLAMDGIQRLFAPVVMLSGVTRLV
jgi:2-amino-4-hydroxy-6-hydroxymethyldihydropteridine diphosphokinase